MECKFERQKKEWYDAIKEAVALIKNEEITSKVDKENELFVKDDVKEEELTFRRTPITERGVYTPSWVMYDERYEHSYNYPMREEWKNCAKLLNIDLLSISDSQGQMDKNKSSSDLLKRSFISQLDIPIRKDIVSKCCEDASGIVDMDSNSSREVSDFQDISHAVIRRHTTTDDFALSTDQTLISSINISLGSEMLLPQVVRPHKIPFKICLNNFEYFGREVSHVL